MKVTVVAEQKLHHHHRRRQCTIYIANAVTFELQVRSGAAPHAPFADTVQLTTDHPWYASERFLSIHDLQTNNHRHVLRSDHIQILNAKLADQIRDHKQAHHNNISSFAISLSRAFARAHGAHTQKNSFAFSFSFSLQEVGKSVCSFAQWISFFSFFPSFNFFFPDRPTDRATSLSLLSSSSPSALGSCACAYELTAVRSSLQVKSSRSGWFHSPFLGPIIIEILFRKQQYYSYLQMEKRKFSFPTFFCRQGMGKIVGKENIAAKVAIIHKKVLVKFGYKWDMKVYNI